MRERDELEVHKTKQRPLLILEHLEDVLDMKGGSIQSEAERLHDIRSQRF
jgi:hypothetical protein